MRLFTLIQYMMRLRYLLVSTLLLLQFCSPLQSSANEADTILSAIKSDYKENADQGYVINFTDVSIVEYIRFVSKILSTNFIFDENELGFNVTIVSEEKISAKNVLSALIQVLRIHNLRLLEQDKNLIITSNGTVNQIPTIISDDIPNSASSTSPLVTRIFRILNVDAGIITTIIKPMLSVSAILEFMPGTNLIIISDINTNVEKVASLLTTLDKPYSPLEIDTYECKHVPIEKLISLASKILLPFQEKSPLILVPHVETNNIFIISTPFLIEKTLTVLEDLDVTSKEAIGETTVSEEKIFIYKIQYQSPEFILGSLKQIADEMVKAGSKSAFLMNSIQSVKWIKDSNSLMFLGNDNSIVRIQEILAKLDSPSSALGPSSFYIFSLRDADKDAVLGWIHQMTENLSQSTSPDESVISALKSVKWIKETNSLLFTGSDHSLKRVKEILTSDDFKQQLKPREEASSFWIYNPTNRSGDEILTQLQEISGNLKEAHLSNPNFLRMLETIRWVPKTNSLIFTGDTTSIEEIKPLVNSLDKTGKIEPQKELPSQFWIYNPIFRSGEVIKAHIEEILNNLKQSELADPSFIKTLSSMRWIAKTNALLFTGDATSLNRIKTIVESIDNKGKALSADEEMLSKKSTFLIYKPVVKTPEALEKSITEIEEDLKVSGLADSALLQAFESMRYVESTKSFLFTGTPDSLEKISELLKRIDIPSKEEPKIQHIGAKTFLIYRTQFADPIQLLASLKALGENLTTAGQMDPELINAIQGGKVIQETHSLLFTGPEETLVHLEELVKKFDVSELKAPQMVEKAPSHEGPSNFVLYTPRYLTGPELIDTIVEFKNNLTQTGVTDKELFDAILRLKWVEKTNSILISGTTLAIDKIEQLLQKFDIPSKEEAPPTIQNLESTSFLIYKLQYNQGSSIQEALQKISQELSKKDSSTNKDILDSIQSLQWIQVTNSLVSTGQPNVLAKLKDLIRNLDAPLKQVFIEVLILETSLSNLQDFGLQWGSKFQYLNKFAGAYGNMPPTSSAIGPPPATTTRTNIFDISKTSNTVGPKAADVPFAPQGFDLGIIGDIIFHKGHSFISLGSLVNAIQTDADSVIIMNPKIITQDNNNSTIFVGTNVPFVGSQVNNNTQGTQSTLVTTSIEYRDLGLNLSITPTLSSSEVVTLDISVDLTEQTGSTPVTTSGVSGIQSSHTSMNTRVTVPNKKFLVLSGMLQDTKAHNRTQVPCLGGLPLIGAAFSDNSRSDAKANILIFLKPHIINSFEEYSSLTDNQEVLIKEESGPKVVQEEIENGMEWVKSPEDN